MDNSDIYKNENLTKRMCLDRSIAQPLKSFRTFDQPVIAEETTSRKHKALLIAVAVALTTQCPHCIEMHSNHARNAGVTDAEMFEVAMVVAAMQAGAGVAHVAHTGQN